MVSTNIAYSYLLKNSYGKYLANQDDYSKSKELYDLLSTTIGPNRPVDQVNIYSTVGTVIAVGLYANIYNHPVEILPWYEETKNSNGNGVLRFTGLDPFISRYTTDVYGKHFFSFTRQYYDLFNNVQGYIEIKQSAKQVLSQALSYESVYGEQLLVFDKYGELIYPLDKNEYQYVFDQIAKLDTSEFREISDGQSSSYAIYSESPYGLNFVITISDDSLFLPTNSYIINVLILTLASLLVAFALSYFLANKITTPIDLIYHEIQHFNLNGYIQKRRLNTKTIELTTLYDRFIDMQHKLVDSVNEQLLLKNQEMQSKMIALQSQMNPHFLFNSIQSIQSMAETNMNKEIVIMCQSMSNILRYISSDSDSTVLLKEEIKYTTDFLCCMSIRYHNDLQFDIDIPEKMHDIKVPKLCVQSLVENSVKFCTTLLPTYHIAISGAIYGNHYEIAVTDNGPGFSSDILVDIDDKIKRIDSTGLLPSLEINGMGLLNVYLRYRILFGENTIFKIENNTNGGAKVTIGGVL